MTTKQELIDSISNGSFKTDMEWMAHVAFSDLGFAGTDLVEADAVAHVVAECVSKGLSDVLSVSLEAR